MTVADKRPILVGRGQVPILFQLRRVGHTIGASTHRLPIRASFDKRRAIPAAVRIAVIPSEVEEPRGVSWR